MADKDIMKILIIFSIFFLFGCSSIPGKLEKLEVGMSKAQMTEIMGSPSERAVGPGSETLYYTHSGVGAEYYRAFYVVLENSQVVSFGPARSGASSLTINSMPQIQVPQSTYQPIPVYQAPVNRPTNCTTNMVGQQAYTTCN